MAKKQTNGNLALEQQRVIVIPAHDEIVARKLRVAAYARVSSSSEDQLNSYRVQNQYYSELISSNPDWEMVDIYADEGITGTSVEKREDFQRMMQDCRKGKIDRILVKSISRFARNTKDCLAAVRELKELGVSILFEEQSIDTSKVSSEMVTAIMASLAQKGSESISSNVRWGVQKRMLDGTFISSSVPYGYELWHGQLRILPSEAQFVKWIFQAYLSGLNAQSIAEQMNQAYALLGAEDTRKWYNTTILYILSNERYIGDSLWQKTYATDSLPTRQIKNTGGKIQYYAEHTHTAIIDKETYSAVQRLREKRKLDVKYNDDYQPNILKKRIYAYVAEYVPEYQIEFAIPYQNKGVMIGSEKPTMVACPNALCKDEYELSWEGTYEYFDLTTGAVRAIRDPNTFYIAATSVGLTDRSNYTTTINEKSIPNAQYPAGGTYSGSTSTSFGTGSQCHGFGLYIYDYLFGSSGAKCSQGFEYIGNYTQTQIKNKLQSFALGTLLRVSYSGSTSDEHTMILVGRDSTGVIIYHANWPDNGTVAISHVTWSGFAQTFPYLDFIICPHNVNVWKPYSSTQHRGACTACGTYLYGSHYAQVGGMGTCLVCGYYGNMPGLTSTGHETE